MVTQDHGWGCRQEHLQVVSVMPRLPLIMVFRDQGQLSQGRELSGRCIAFHNTALEAAQLLPQSICQEWVVKASHTLEQENECLTSSQEKYQST